MDYYCAICDKHINSRSKHFKSKSHIVLGKCDCIILPLKNIDFNEVDELYNLYLIEHNKKYYFYVIRCRYNLVFNNGQCFRCVTAKLTNNRAPIWWKEFF